MNGISLCQILATGPAFQMEEELEPLSYLSGEYLAGEKGPGNPFIDFPERWIWMNGRGKG